MRRILVLAAMAGAIAACAGDSPDRTAVRDGMATTPQQRIEAFVAARRAADSGACRNRGLLEGSDDHAACMRALADERRRAARGPAGDAIERSATGRCWNPDFKRRLACFDV